MKAKLLEIIDLSVSFNTAEGEIEPVSKVNLSIGKKETVCLVGESGSGKTLTALSIIRLVPSPGKIKSGQILFYDKNGKSVDLVGLQEEDLADFRGGKISMIFQEPFSSLNPVFSVGDQIKESAELHLKLKGEELNNKVLESLRLVNIPDEKKAVNSYPHELSGGMRQRVMIAMGLVSNPDLIIADEPTTALDVTIQAQILKLIAGLKETLSLSVLLITHDLGIVNEVADRVYVMYAGRIMESANKTPLFDKPLHPYTEGLLKSIPDIDEVKDRLFTIPGSIPDTANMPSGCRFHPRCPYVMDICKVKEPALTEIEEDRLVRCFKYSDKLEKNDE